MTGFRLATFNVENLHTGADFATRIAVLRPQLQRLSADILCLQEVDGEREGGARSGGGRPRTLPALDALITDTPYAAYHRAASERRPGSALDVHNLVVLSRFPIRRVARIWHDRVPERTHVAVTVEGAEIALRFDRPALHAEIEAPGGTLHVFNLHLRAPVAQALPGAKSAPFRWKTQSQWAEGFALAAMKRALQALEVRLAVDAILAANAEARIAVCGDLNAEAHETAVRILIAADDDTGTGAHAATALIPLARAVPASLRWSVLHHGRPMLLDHILVSRALYGAFRGAEIHNEPLGDEAVAFGRIGAPPESLHAPLAASFETMEN